MPSEKASSPRKTSVKKRATLVKKATRSVKNISRSASRRVATPRELSISARFSQWIDSVSPTSILAIGLCVVVVSIIHSLFVDIGDWYASLPVLNGPIANWVYEYILTGIFALVTFSIVVIWNIPVRGRAFLMWLFVLTGMLHVMWSMFFFALHLVQISFLDIVALWILVFTLVLLTWKRSRMASLMLLPYLAWVTFVGAFNGLIAFEILI